MKFPLLSNLLLREYDKEALTEITSGKDLLPFPTNEKRNIAERYPSTAKPELMNGDNLLQAVFYNTSLKSIFKNIDLPEITKSGLSNKSFHSAAIQEIRECLKTTKADHLGKYHRNLLSLMIMTPNLPKDILLDLVDRTDVLQKDVCGKTALDYACISMTQVNPVNKEAVVAIYNKAEITDEVEYGQMVRASHDKNAQNIVAPHSYIDGFKQLKKLSLSIEEDNKKKPTP